MSHLTLQEHMEDFLIFPYNCEANALEYVLLCGKPSEILHRIEFSIVK